MGIQVTLDRIVLFVDNVDHYYFQKMTTQYNEMDLQLAAEIKYWVGSHHKDYRHNLTIKSTKSETSIYIGYEHNAARSRTPASKRLKIEYNPAKLQIAEAQMLFRPLCKIIGHQNPILIKAADIAYDISDVPLHGVHIVSRHGAREMRYGSTRYYGQRSRDGRLKVYDKAAERKIKDATLTRVEYTAVYDDPIPMDQAIDCPHVTINDRYTISVGEVTRGEDALIYCAMLAISHGEIMLRDFSRHWQSKLRTALTTQSQIDLDRLLLTVWTNELKKVKSVIY